MRFQSIIASFLLFSPAGGCLADLNIPEGAQIDCEIDAQCPEDFACRTQRCVRVDSNQAPLLTLGTLARALDTLTIPVLAVDAESDNLSLAATFRVGAGASAPATISPLELTSSPQGVSHDLTWAAGIDLDSTAYSDELFLELQVSDADNEGQPVTAGPLLFGNDAPRVLEVTVDDTTVTGNTVVRFHLSDSAGDEVSLSEFEVGFDAAFSSPRDVPTTSGISGQFPGGALVGLETTADGIWHNVTWRSDLVVPEDIAQAWLRIAVSDSFGATSTFAGAGPFAIDNASTPPVISFVAGTEPTGTLTGAVSVSYQITDADNDLCALFVYFSFDAIDWIPALTGSATTGLDPSLTSHDFVWQTSQIDPDFYPEVYLRLLIHDSLEGNSITTGPFALDTRTAVPPTVIIDPVGLENGERDLTQVTISYVVSDPASDSVDVQIEFTPDRDAAAPVWHPATAGGGDGTIGLATTPSGITYQFVWDVLADAQVGGKGLTWAAVDTDEAGTTTADMVRAAAPVAIRIHSTDATLLDGLTRESNRFAVGNDPPTASLESVAAQTSGRVPLQFDVSDSLADLATVDVRFRLNDPAIDPTNLWRRAALVMGTVEDLATSQSGRSYVVVWDSAAELDANLAAGQGIGALTLDSVELQVRAFDHPQLSVTHYGSWSTSATISIENQTPPRIEPIYGKTDGELRNGAIAIAYRLIDEQRDPADVRFEYTVDQGVNWYRATEYPIPTSEGVIGLPTAPADAGGGGGVEHLFVWESGADLLERTPAVSVRATARDTLGGASLPVEVISPSPTGPAAGASAFVRVDPTSPNEDTEAIVVDDFNGDGFLDGVVASRATYGVGIYLGAVGGTLAFDQWIVTGVPFADVVAGYFDGNSTLDIAVTEAESSYGAADGKLWILLGNGDGSFSPEATTPTSLNGAPVGLVAHDFDANGSPDLALADRHNAAVTLWEGTGNGRFAMVESVSLAHPLRLAHGDVDADGNEDVVVVGSPLADIVTLLGGGDLSLGGPIPSWISTGAPGDDLDLGDLDGDGLLDVVRARAGTSSYVDVAYGQGDGTFGDAYSVFDASQNRSSVRLGDFNRDGILDVVSLSSSPSFVTVFPGTVGGRLAAPTRMTAARYVRDLAVADLNFDRSPDIIAAGGNGISTFLSQEPTSIGEWLGTPTYIDSAVSGTHLYGVDLDKDGVWDALCGYVNSQIGQHFGRRVAGIGNGTFADRLTTSPPAASSAFAPGDFDADGVVDIAATVRWHWIGGVANFGLQIGLAVADADGIAEPAYLWTEFSVPDAPTAGNDNWTYDTAVCDLDGDGAQDILSVSGSPTVIHRFFGQLDGDGPTGSFVAAGDLALPANPSVIECADLDHDGAIDLAVGLASTQGLDIWLGNGAGGFSRRAGSPFSTGSDVVGLTVGDFNQDGANDLATTLAANELAIWLGDATGLFTAEPSSPYATGRRPRDPYDIDLNADGYLDIIVPNYDDSTVQLFVASTQAPGVFSSGPVLPSVASPYALSAGDFNHDGVTDLLVSNANDQSISKGLYHGRRDVPRDGWVRRLTAFDATTQRGNAVGIDAPFTGLDLFGDSVPATLGLRPYRGLGDAGPDSVLLGSAGTAPAFLDLARGSVLGPSLTGKVRPLSLAWVTDGETRWVRARAPEEAPENGARRVPQGRFSTDGTPVDLDLSSTDFGAQRGVIVDLPWHYGSPGPDPVLVVARFRQLVRANEVCGDPLGPTDVGCTATTADPSAASYMPRVWDDRASAYRDYVRAEYAWVIIPMDPNNDLPVGLTAGMRWVRDDAGERIRVLVDRMGILQAFVAP